MIIREHTNEFVMIKQHDHAQISKQLYEYLSEPFLPDLTYRSSVSEAIRQHDVGWIPFDETPFWNDQTNKPYSFTDFPTEPKTVLYEHGINEVETYDQYAALLCSEHYLRFLEKSTNQAAKTFVQKEQARQTRLLNQLDIEGNNWKTHYDYLRFFDQLSLFICLNEPGTPQEEIHHFFDKGLSCPALFKINKSLYPKWIGQRDIQLDAALFETEVAITIQQKCVQKQDIYQHGLLQAYQAAEGEDVIINVVDKTMN